MQLGIDFGTTQTVVALCDRGNFPIVCFEDFNGDTHDGYATAVAFCGPQRRYGPDALASQSEPGWTVLRSFKRLLSTPGIGPQHPVTLGPDQHTTVLALITDFLTALRRDLLERSTLPDTEDLASMRAVVAVPANAHSAQRFITLEAFKQAGFHIDAILNEPSAGALEYAHRYHKTFSSRRQDVIVYDLGGGTFDASLVDMSDSDHVVRASLGLARLGGDDFDEALVQMALQSVELAPEDVPAQAIAALRAHCRELKESLSANTRRVHVELAHCLGTDAPKEVVTLDVKDYYQACRPLLDRTLEIVAHIQNLPAGKLHPTVAGLYVVGGASELPAVGRHLRETFGRRVRRAPYPSAATAVGLAIAAQNPHITVTERLSRHFGLFRELRGGQEISFDVIFDAKRALPQGKPLEVVRTYRPQHNIGHLRYVEASAIDPDTGGPAGDVTPFADVRFAFDPDLRSDDIDLSTIDVVRRPEHGPLIEERYTMHPSGIIEVTITDLEDHHQRHYRIGTKP